MYDGLIPVGRSTGRAGSRLIYHLMAKCTRCWSGDGRRRPASITTLFSPAKPVNVKCRILTQNSIITSVMNN